MINILENNISKSEINAERILKRIHIHNLDSGGVFTLITGSQGSAKTSTMLSFLDYTVKNFPEEKIFFSNCYFAPFQFVKLGRDSFHIMVKTGSGVTFHDRANKLKQIYPNVTKFKDFQECYDKAIPGKCNAVFFGNRFVWMDFLHFLRSVGEWTHIYFDELSEICPQFQSGETFHRIGRSAIDLKEVRKCMMNVHSNTQSVADIDHRVRSKVMIKIYLPGARSGADSRISQRAIDNLNEDPVNGNESYVEYSGKFGKSRFKDIYKPIPGLQWEARVNGK